MIKPWVLFLGVLGYLSLLFLLAYIAEMREKSGRSIVSNPYVYSLSLAVYCTSWTFYGSVGKAANSGFTFLTIYIGPTIMAVLWYVVLKKMILIAKTHKITTISDFIGLRYGNSFALSALITIVATIGIAPYLGLQVKAIMNTFTILTGEARGTMVAGWVFTLVLGLFAIIFGTRRPDASERHEGLIFAIAFESIVKLIAFLSVGIYVTFVLFGGFGDIIDRIKATDYGNLLFLGSGTSVSQMEWGSLLFLSMMAIMFLPRQFHVLVVENSDVRHVSKAMWLFPLYLFLINIFVMPVALGGLLLGGSQNQADNFVLTIPLGQGNISLALFVFIGGFSAAISMIIVESLAISTMIMNSLVMPFIYRMKRIEGLRVIFPLLISTIKRIIIMGCVFLGYFFAVSIGEFYSLVDMGLKSFEAVTIFAPAVLFGLYWKKGNKYGAMAGIFVSFVIWFYTLLVPALQKSGLIQNSGFLFEIINSDLLNPHGLFGLRNLDKWSHSLFWGMLFNVSLYVGISLFTRQDVEEEKQSLLFVESYSPRLISGKGTYSITQIRDILGQYIGRMEAAEIVDNFIMKNQIHELALTQEDLIKLRDEAERVLSGAVGSAIAKIIFEDKVILTEQERGELSVTIKHMTDTLRLSRQELAEANQNLAYLKDFSENIIESAPVGIITTDALFRITSWNREIETLTDTKKENVANRPITEVLPWLSRDYFYENTGRDLVVQTPMTETYKINVSPLKDPSGGFVVIIEDITEKIKMEEQLLQTSKLAGLGKLTAGISHEIGNPLASISSLVQELRSLDREDVAHGPFFHDSLVTINTHIDRIAGIVRSLADFARLSSSEKMRCSIPEILERMLNLVRYDKRFKNIQFDTKVSTVPDIYINPDKMQQVFLNIMLNALDAMPEGGKLCISITQVDDANIEITFSDTGKGIDDAVIDRIFDPFFTTKPPGKGTGLGLSICYGIIKEHRGSISVTSNRNEGTTFVIRVPVMG